MRDLLRIRRRLGYANMDEANPAPAMRAGLSSPTAACVAISAALCAAGSVAAAVTAGIEGLDTSALRMTFPSRLRIRLRDGSTRVVEGSEPGSCGRPLAEQRAVVEERLRSPGSLSVPLP